jgi:hypothetical protein
VEVMEMVEVAKPIIPIEVTVIEAVEATKSIVPIKVTIVETVKAKCGAAHWSALHRHPRHRSTMPTSHLRRRSRDGENARYHATEQNEFFPVHSAIGF